MSTALRTAANTHSRVLSAALRNQKRTFFSPFPASNKSPLTTPPSSASTANQQSDVVSSTSTVYVVSEPDASDRPYSVPSGAYPTSAPYVNFAHTDAPGSGANVSSTSPTQAHPDLTRRVPHNETGVGDSAAVRYKDAPGELGNNGGSDGGMGLMDGKTTNAPESELADRNPPPIQEVGEEISKMGVKEAWKHRK